MDKKFVRRKQAALIVSLSERTIDRLIVQGRIEAFKSGKVVLIVAKSLTKENLISIKPKFPNNN